MATIFSHYLDSTLHMCLQLKAAVVYDHQMTLVLLGIWQLLSQTI